MDKNNLSYQTTLKVEVKKLLTCALIARFTIHHVFNRRPLRIPLNKLIGQLNVS
jgi:hypothetical protein